MAPLRARALALALLVPGCAGATFATSFPSGGGRLSAALATAKRDASTTSTAVVVGVGEHPRTVFAYDLRARRMLFNEPSDAVALPVLAGTHVVVAEPQRITVRALADGAVVRTLDDEGMHLVGAAGDDKLTAIVLSTGGALDPRSRLVLLEGTKVRADARIPQLVGRPAVLGGLAFVPHHRVLLSVVDAQGKERARVRIRRDVSSYALAHRGDIYFGQQGMYLLDPELERDDGRKAPYLALDLKSKLPGNPTIVPDPSTPAPPLESAAHHVGVSAVPTRAEGAVKLEDDTLYLAFYRLLIALSPSGETARWAHRTETDLVGVQQIAGGVVAVEQSGQMTALDALGRAAYEGSLGMRTLAAAIHAEQLDFGTASGEPTAAAKSLAEAANDPDRRLVPVQALAASALGHVEDDEAARALISLCSQSAGSPRVGEAACQALGSRPWPSDAVLDALAQQADYLDQIPPPPLAALADAALAGNDARAVAPLLARLADPATPVGALPSVMRALGALGDAASAAQIAAFVRLYHADPVELELEEALASGMEALGKLDPSRAHGVLEPIAHDALARVGVRSAAQNVLATLDVAEAEAGNAEQATSEIEETPTEEASAPKDEPPSQLRAEHVESALSNVRLDLARCVRDAPERPASARLVIVIGGAGEVLEVKTLPLSVESCAKALVQSATFPATKYGKRAVMTYVVPR